MTTYYVATSGLDSNTGLTTGDPFQTIDKFLTVAIAGDECAIFNGTYAEDSGSGYLDITNKDYASEVHLYSYTGDVLITGASGLYNVKADKGTIQNLKFSNIDFGSQETGTYVFLCAFEGNITNLTFSGCEFIARSGISDLDAIFSCTHNINGLNFEGQCEFVLIDTVNTGAISLKETAKDCYFDLVMTGEGYNSNGLINIKKAAGTHTFANDCIINCSDASPAIHYEAAATGDVSITFESGTQIISSGDYACIISGGIPENYIQDISIEDDVEFSGDGGLIINAFVHDINIGDVTFYSNSSKPALIINPDNVSGDINNVDVSNIIATSITGTGAVFGTNLTNLTLNSGEYSGYDYSLSIKSDGFNIGKY